MQFSILIPPFTIGYLDITHKMNNLKTTAGIKCCG